MSDEMKEDVRVTIYEGDCYGWFSPVYSQCTSGTCMLSERCKQHTVQLQQNSDDTTVVGSQEQEVTRQSAQGAPKRKAVDTEELYRTSFFNKVIEKISPLINHTNFNYGSGQRSATFKSNGRVVAYLDRTKKVVRITIGRRGEDEIKEEILFSNTVDDATKEAEAFVKRAIKEIS